jgi:hypothetical protein
MDVSTLSSDEVNRQIALRRGDEWYMYRQSLGGYPPSVVSQWAYLWWRAPSNYLEWHYCGALLEEMICGPGFDIEFEVGRIWAAYAYSGVVSADTCTDAIRRAWLAWDMKREEKDGN